MQIKEVCCMSKNGPKMKKIIGKWKKGCENNLLGFWMSCGSVWSNVLGGGNSSWLFASSLATHVCFQILTPMERAVVHWTVPLWSFQGVSLWSLELNGYCTLAWQHAVLCMRAGDSALELSLWQSLGEVCWCRVVSSFRGAVFEYHKHRFRD